VAALQVTVSVAAAGTVVAAVLGLVLATARASRARWVRWPAHGFVELVRSTPLLVQLFLLYYGLPELGLRPSAWMTGTLALGVHYGCYASESYRAGIEAVPRGQWDAARALGFGPVRTWTSVVLPQAVPRVLPALGNCAVALLKETPLLTVVTLVEVLGTARNIGAETGRYLEPMTLVGLLFLVLTLLSTFALRRLEGWLRPRAGLS
jgi:polar amino acid transport system permease protein